MTEPLAIHAVGLTLPESRSVVELADAAGGDTSEYRSWPRIHVGGADDQPATLASRALDDALQQVGISASDLKIVVSTGMSREYLGSWSVAAEVMRLQGAPSSCTPLDVSCGCMGTLWALSLMEGWLASRGGGYAAIVSGERLSDTIDRADNGNQHLWGYGDGGSALIVSVGVDAPAIWRVASTGFASYADFNGLVRIEYGGTKNPFPPEGGKNARKFAPVPLNKVRDVYVEGYREAFAAARKDTAIVPERVVCNQVSPQFLPAVAMTAGVPLDRVVVTGDDAGHVGSVDLGIGLRRLLDAGEHAVPLALTASTPFAYGAALLEPVTAS
ncbi:hypothetical protein ACWF9G_27675 [Nocardia sp. NPDC055029]